MRGFVIQAIDPKKVEIIQRSAPAVQNADAGGREAHDCNVGSISLFESDDSRLARLEERSRHMHINDESLCDSCHARLGTKLFAMYKCYRRLGQSKSVTGRDFKRDVLIKPGWLVNR